jgi:hypothetical protein
MAKGDSQRAWFQEMLNDLKSTWTRDMTWEELADFCRRMTAKRQKIKDDRCIKPPHMTCKCCGGQMKLSPISIRSAMFALRKLELIDETEFKKLDREWSKYRKANNLDAFGNKS